MCCSSHPESYDFMVMRKSLTFQEGQTNRTVQCTPGCNWGYLQKSPYLPTGNGEQVELPQEVRAALAEYGSKYQYALCDNGTNLELLQMVLDQRQAPYYELQTDDGVGILFPDKFTGVVINEDEYKDAIYSEAFWRYLNSDYPSIPGCPNITKSLKKLMFRK